MVDGGSPDSARGRGDRNCGQFGPDVGLVRRFVGSSVLPLFDRNQGVCQPTAEPVRAASLAQVHPTPAPENLPPDWRFPGVSANLPNKRHYCSEKLRYPWPADFSAPETAGPQLGYCWLGQGVVQQGGLLPPFGNREAELPALIRAPTASTVGLAQGYHHPLLPSFVIYRSVIMESQTGIKPLASPITTPRPRRSPAASRRCRQGPTTPVA